jgi:hypothetical protein
MWQWDEGDGPPFTLELCETELVIRADIIRQIVSAGLHLNLVELTVCRAVAHKLLVFAVAWLDSRLDLVNVTTGGADIDLELTLHNLVEAKNEISRPNLQPDQLVEALESAAGLLHVAQKACRGRLGAMAN